LNVQLILRLPRVLSFRCRDLYHWISPYPERVAGLEPANVKGILRPVSRRLVWGMHAQQIVLKP
jgi:hypothetical protein